MMMILTYTICMVKKRESNEYNTENVDKELDKYIKEDETDFRKEREILYNG